MEPRRSARLEARRRQEEQAQANQPQPNAPPFHLVRIVQQVVEAPEDVDDGEAELDIQAELDHFHMFLSRHRTRRFDFGPSLGSHIPLISRKRKALQDGLMKKPKWESDPHRPSLENLPSNILVYVFSMLSPRERLLVECVSRKLRRISMKSWSRQTHLDWTHFYGATRYHRAEVGNKEVMMFLKRAKRLNSLSLDSFRDALDYSIARGISCLCGPSLTTLVLRGVMATNSSLQQIGLGCPNLRCINLASCFKDSVIERGVGSMLSNLHHLEHLDVSMNERFEGYPSFKELPPTITKLCLNYSYSLTGEALLAMRERLPNLRQLEMNGVETIPANILSKVFSNFNSLESLSFRESQGDRNGSLIYELGEMPSLRDVYLDDNGYIGDMAIQSLCRGSAKSLSDLSFSNQYISFDRRTFEQFASFRRLESIELSYMDRMRDEDLLLVARLGTLRNVKLCQCPLITGRSLCLLITFNQKLSMLLVNGCAAMKSGRAQALHAALSARQARAGSFVENLILRVRFDNEFPPLDYVPPVSDRIIELTSFTNSTRIGDLEEMFYNF